MWLGFYTLLYYLTASVLMPKEYLKRSSQIRNKWLKDKLAIFPKIASKRDTIWIHAVSVGEVIAVSRLIKILSKKYDILLSTITDTGQEIAKKKFKNIPIEIIYLPLDCPFAIKRTLKAFTPKALLIAETELWPNLIVTASKQIPVILINGRLSEKSFKRYLKIKFFIKPILNRLSCIAVQEDLYKERFKALGVSEKKIYITGNTKFDIEIPEISFFWEQYLIKPVIIAGSTHYPEEEIITKAFIQLNESATLLIVPRHPERFEEVENTIKNLLKNCPEIRFFKLSSFQIYKKDKQPFKKLIILVDQIGILGALYRLCDIAIIGGSFISHGGQNPLEAFYWKKPVIVGSSMENFPFIKEFLQKEACVQIDKNSLKDYLEFLIKNPALRKEMGEKAYSILKIKSGATQNLLKLLTDFL